MKETMPRSVLGLSKDTDTTKLLTPTGSELIELEKIVPVNIEIDRSVRAKVTDLCGMACIFCHNEGTPVNHSQPHSGRVSVFENTNGSSFMPGIMLPDIEFRTAIISLMNALELDELHWTGGEPTAHRDLHTMTKEVRDLGLRVKMTSNGESGGRKMEELLAAGLESLNFSIFGTTPVDFAKVQAPRFQTIKSAEIKLAKLDKSIKKARELGIPTKANIVMRNMSDGYRIRSVIRKYLPLGVEVRILNDLSGGAESVASIYNLLGELEAIPTEIKVTAGSSIILVRYKLPNGNMIGVKQIRNNRSFEVCHPCEYNSNKDCKEGYYGIRLYVDTDNRYYVGVCLQRMDLTVPLNEFTDGPLPEIIRQYRSDDYKAIIKQLGTNGSEL